MKRVLLLLMTLLLSLSVFGSSTGYDFPDDLEFITNYEDFPPTHERITNEAFKLFCEKEGSLDRDSTFGVLIDENADNILDCSELILSDDQLNYDNHKNDKIFESPIRSIILGSRYPDLFEYPGLYYQMIGLEGDNDSEFKKNMRAWAFDLPGMQYDPEVNLGVSDLYGYYHSQINTSTDRKNGKLIVRILNDFIKATLFEVQSMSLYRDQRADSGYPIRNNIGRNIINSYYSYCQDVPVLCRDSGNSFWETMFGFAALGDIFITGGFATTVVGGTYVATQINQFNGKVVYQADWTKVTLGILFHAIADSFAHDLRFRKCENGSCKMVIAAPINSEFESGWGFNHDNGIKNNEYEDLRREILMEYFSGNEQKVENLENEDIENYDNYKSHQKNPDILRTFDFNPCLLIDGKTVNSIMSYCFCMISNYDQYEENNFINSVKTLIDPDYFNPFVPGIESGTADYEGADLWYHENDELPGSLPLSISSIPLSYFWKGDSVYGYSDYEWLRDEKASAIAKYAIAEFLEIVKYSTDNPTESDILNSKINDYLEKWFSYDPGPFEIKVADSFVETDDGDHYNLVDLDTEEPVKLDDYETYPWYDYHMVDLLKINEENKDYLRLPWDLKPPKASENDGYRFVVKLSDSREHSYDSVKKVFYAAKDKLTVFRTWDADRINLPDMFEEYALEELVNEAKDEWRYVGATVEVNPQNEYDRKWMYNESSLGLTDQMAFAFIPAGYAMCFKNTHYDGEAKEIRYERCHYGGTEGKTAYFSQFHIKGNTVKFWDKNTGTMKTHIGNDSQIVVFPVDSDFDGIPFVMNVNKQLDNCPFHSNPDQNDRDDNGVGDACQDSDDDGVLDIDDNCPGYKDGEDADLDGIPDGCDINPFVPNIDNDGDGVVDVWDNCAPTQEEYENAKSDPAKMIALKKKYSNPAALAPLKEIIFAPFPGGTNPDRENLYKCPSANGNCVSSGLSAITSMGIRVWMKIKRIEKHGEIVVGENYVFVPILPTFLETILADGESYEIEWPAEIDACRGVPNQSTCLKNAVNSLVESGKLDIYWQPDYDLDFIGDKCDDSLKTSRFSSVEEYLDRQCTTNGYQMTCTTKKGDVINIDLQLKGAGTEGVTTEVYYCNVKNGKKQFWGDPGYCTRGQNDWDKSSVNGYSNAWSFRPVYNFGFSHATDPVLVDKESNIFKQIWNPVTRVFSTKQAEDQFSIELVKKSSQTNYQSMNIPLISGDFSYLKDLTVSWTVYHDYSKIMWSWRSDFCKYNADRAIDCEEYANRTDENSTNPFYYALSTAVSVKDEPYLRKVEDDTVTNPEHFYNDSIFARAERYSALPQTAEYTVATGTFTIRVDWWKDYSQFRPPLIDDILPEEFGTDWMERRASDIWRYNEFDQRMVYKTVLNGALSIVSNGSGMYYTLVKEDTASGGKKYFLYHGTQNDESDWQEMGEISGLPNDFSALSAVYFNERFMLAVKTQSGGKVLYSVPLKTGDYGAVAVSAMPEFNNGKLYVSGNSLFALSEKDGMLNIARGQILKSNGTMIWKTLNGSGTTEFRYSPSFAEFDGNIVLAGGFLENGDEMKDMQMLNYSDSSGGWTVLHDNMDFNLNSALIRKEGSEIIFYDSSTPTDELISTLTLNTETFEFTVEDVELTNPHFASSDSESEQCITFVDNDMYSGIISGGVCLPVMIGSEGTFDTGKTNYAVAGIDGVIYVAQGNGFEVFEAGTMTKTGSRSLYGPVKDLVVKGTKLFAAAGNGIDVFDISAKENPVLTKHIATYGDTTSFDIEGNDLYVGDGQGIKVFDTETLALKKQKNTSGDTEALEYFDGKIFVYEWSGFRIYDAATMNRLYSNGFYCNDPKLRSDEENVYLACGNYVRRIEWNYSLTTVNGKKESFQRGYANENILYLPNANKITAGTIGIAPVPVCGNGIVETGEKCDKNTVQCTTLCSDYISGTATCNSTCSGYNTGSCEEDDGWGGSSGNDGDSDGW